jgi:hypothetical protein
LDKKLRGANSILAEKLRLRLEEIGSLLNLKKPADWYDISPEQILKTDSSIGYDIDYLLRRIFQNRPSIDREGELKTPILGNNLQLFEVLEIFNSFCECGGNRLHANCKCFQWTPWNFKHFRVPSYIWLELANQRKYLDWLANLHGINSQENWYSFKNLRDIIQNNNGSNLIKLYENSIFNLLRTCFPEYYWLPYNFKYLNVPKGYWMESSNIKSFMDNSLSELKSMYKKTSMSSISDVKGKSNLE